MMEMAMEMFFLYQNNQITAEEFLDFCGRHNLHPQAVVTFVIMTVNHLDE